LLVLSETAVSARIRFLWQQVNLTKEQGSRDLVFVEFVKKQIWLVHDGLMHIDDLITTYYVVIKPSV